MKTWDFDDFFILSRYKNGNLKVVISVENKANIYKLLKEKGFGFLKFKNQFKFYRKNDENFKFTHLNEFNYFFLQEFLEKELIFESKGFSSKDFLELSEIILLKDIRIVENDNLFKYYLYHIPTSKEMHDLKMDLDYDYKINFDNDQFLKFFKENSFEECIDLKSDISNGELIYFKNINNENYLIFNKHGPNYDCWVAKFNKEKDVGLKLPNSLKKIKINVNLKEDFNLLRQYLN